MGAHACILRFALEVGNLLKQPDFSLVDSIFKKFVEDEVAPGVSYGVTYRGALIHVGGFGMTQTGGEIPHARSIFRIASMTKSFTGAAILLLRDEGLLNLDDPVTKYLPEMSAVKLPTTDSPELTLRLLLTMSAGFPTDDPWADRQEAMTPDELGDLIKRGFTFAHVPGTRFEYSNLAYVLAGRVVSRVSGMYFTDFVRTRFLEPLDMKNTRFSEEELDSALLTQGHKRVDGAWEPLDFSREGEFSALGGLFSTVEDLAIWSGGMLSAFDPHPDTQHPLSRASRREMQQGYRVIPPNAHLPFSDSLSDGEAHSYGFGLVLESDTRFGVSAGHGGGYPGYGSHMRWHLAAGYGVIALANSTYAWASRATKHAHLALLRQLNVSSHQVNVLPETLNAERTVRELLKTWDDEKANKIFANNVDMDQPRNSRIAAIQKAIADIGGLEGNSFSIRTPSAAQMAWSELGKSGHLSIFIQLTPENPPLVQTLTVTAVKYPEEKLARIIEENFESAAATANSLDGPVALSNEYVSGNGLSQATRVAYGARGTWHFTVKINPITEEIIESKVVLASTNETHFTDQGEAK